MRLVKARRYWVLFMLGVWVTLACKGPQFLGVVSTGSPETATSTARLSDTPPPVHSSPSASEIVPGSATAYPGPVQSPTLVYPEPVTSTTPYPGPILPSPSAASDQTYPGPTQPAYSTPTQAQYPGPAVGGSPSPTSVSALIGTPSPTVGGPYPGPSGNVTQTPTPEFTGIPSLTPMFTRTPTPTGVFVNTPTPGAGIVVTATPLPTITPTVTPVPTATRPSIPPPPWVSSKLQATDPSTVELASGKVQLIWFFAFWDGPSQAMAPLVHALESQYAERMNFIYLDIDDPANTLFKEELGYRSQPHFFLVDRDGNDLREWQGYVSVQELQSAIEGALN